MVTHVNNVTQFFQKAFKFVKIEEVNNDYKRILRNTRCAVAGKENNLQSTCQNKQKTTGYF